MLSENPPSKVQNYEQNDETQPQQSEQIRVVLLRRGLFGLVAPVRAPICEKSTPEDDSILLPVECH